MQARKMGFSLIYERMPDGSRLTDPKATSRYLWNARSVEDNNSDDRNKNADSNCNNTLPDLTFHQSIRRFGSA